MGVLILMGVIMITVLLGRYALSEGRRVEQQKKFMKNLKNFDKRNKQ